MTRSRTNLTRSRMFRAADDPQSNYDVTNVQGLGQGFRGVFVGSKSLSGWTKTERLELAPFKDVGSLGLLLFLQIQY